MAEKKGKETQPETDEVQEQDQEKARDEYWQLTEDFAQIVRRAEQSYQEKAPGREIDFVSIFMGSRSGIICTADEEGIPQIIVTGEETDNQGRKRTQRFFIGLQGEVATKDTAFLTVNLAEDETTVKEFEASSQGHNLVKQAIERAKKRGEKIQRKIDEENYEWFPFYHVEGRETSINEDVEPKVNLDLVVSLVANARQVIKNELGAKVDKIRVNFVKWTENFEYADTEDAKIDHIIPRLGFTIQVKTKDGSEAFGAIRGAMGGMEILGRYGDVEREEDESNADYYRRVLTELAKEVAKEAIDLDRAQGASILGTECPVIFSPQVTGALVHEVYGHTSEGDIICENRRSKTARLTLKSRIGAQVSDYPNFTIIDTGAAEVKLGRVKIKHPFGALIVDEHGCPAKETVLIERGIQVNVLNDRYTFNEIVDGLKEEIARGMKKHGLTGSVRREKYDMLPQVRMTNTYLLPDEKGPKSLEEMAARIPRNKKGVYIKTCKGAWVSPDDGAFAINGNLCYLIENAQVTDKPIREVRVTGNVAKFVDSIKAVGSSKTIDRTFTGYCVGPETLIVTREGLKPIREVQEGDWVLTHEGHFRPVLKTFRHRVSETIYRIKPQGGIPFHITGNHRILVTEARKVRRWWNDQPDYTKVRDFAWVPVEQLRPTGNKSSNDWRLYAVMPQYVGEAQDQPEITEEMMELFGWYLAEGNLGAKHYGRPYSVQFSAATDSGAADRIKRLCEEAYGVKPYVNERLDRSSVELALNSVELVKRFAEWGEYAHGKGILPWVYRLPVRKQVALLRGYWSGDGSASRGRRRLSTSTASPALAGGLMLLLGQLGIYPGFRIEEAEAVNARVAKSGGFRVNFDAYRLEISGPQATRLANMLGETIGDCQLDIQHHIHHGDHFLPRIQSIEEVSVEDFVVHNLHVAEDNSYVTPGMTLHNCGKANQWVPVEGGGPLVYIEDAKLGTARYRPWSELVEEYHRQHDQVLKGQRAEEGIYLPEFAGEMGEGVPQAKVCLLTATLPGGEERDWIMGRRDRANFVLRDGELMERGEWFE